MSDKRKEVADRILAGMRTETERVCPTCGHDSTDDNTFFKCEWCNRAICSYCHKMTNDFTAICPKCVKEKGLTDENLQL
ncbi:MAG: hypothetical protein E4H14_10415 [Candidatus Thorarchaeota archaeon]|nr:MAG: hypothetical protein E4H14_10415 [Candidatus Thorarchaeota archaeon]